jgi:hypothetical protein
MSSERHAPSPFDLELEVVDEKGAPVAGVAIDVIENDLVARTCGRPLHGQADPVTDAAGRATLRGLPGLGFGSRYYVVAVHPDYAEGILDRAEGIPRVDGVARARITLTRGMELAGQVVDGAVDRKELIVRAVWGDPSVPGCYGVVREARVAEDGSFRLDGLHPGPHVLLLLYGEALLARTRVEAPSAEPIVITRVRVRDVAGVVLDERGAPLEGAQLRLWSPALFRDATSDAEGRFVIRDVAASQTLTLEAYRETPDDREMLSQCTLLPGEDDVHVRCDARERTPVDLVVRGWQGGETLLLIREMASESFACSRHFTGPEISGRVWLPPGRHELFVESGCEEETGFSPKRYAKAFLEPRDAQPLRLVCDLVPTFDVAFDLLDEGTGEPIVGARLSAHPVDLWGCFFSENTDDSGRVSLSGLGATRLRLSIEAPGFDPLVREIQLGEASPPIVLRMRRTAEPSVGAPPPDGGELP